MANPQLEHGFVRIANEIWDEVIRRDFSKRQKDILFLVWRLSYGCQKRYAYIPRMRQFQLCGVSETKVKTELEYLERSRVLIWDRESKTFEINKDYESWYVSLVKAWDEGEFNELLALNLSRKVSQNGKENFPKREENLPETGSDEEGSFPKRETETSQKGKQEFPEKGNTTPDEPLSGAASGAPKDIIKDIIKNNKEDTEVLNTNQDTEHSSSTTKTDFSFSRIYRIYEQHLARDGKITDLEVEDLNDQFDTFGGEWLLDAMREAVRQNKRSLAYINGILQGYKSRGGTQREIKAIVPAGNGNADGKPNRQQLQNELAAQKIREAEERERERDQENFYADPERL
ncbi:replication protein [Paenibacillus ginsengarvi]|uniref:DnaD domain protein n=1 Tax=Paenibacillus ginsengarvi TaxID=400777 RepID=A0A3B0BTT2_9BACL|nr:replication protein [Paenibacillus ginsengarvi]RKN75036.1 DnaD domain protein [Paenibacillus ginsengarvi]